MRAFGQALYPCLVFLLGRAQGNVMDASGALSGEWQFRLDGDVQLRSGSARTHFINVNCRARPRAILSDCPHAENIFKNALGAIEPGNADRDRTQAANLMLGRDGASFPWVDASCPTIINETKTLPFEIFKIESQPPVTLGNAAVTHIVSSEAAPPPLKGVFPCYPQSGPDDAVGASLLRCGWPNEEGQIGAWTPLPVGIKKMVRTHIVLIDGFLYQAHAEDVRVETVITARVRRNGCEMVDTVELHGALYTIRTSLPMLASKEYPGQFPAVASKPARQGVTTFRQRLP